MNPLWFGDSYDLVKRFFVEVVRSLGYAVYIDKAAVLPGVTYIGAIIEAPGHIRQIGPVNRSLFGEADGSQSTRGRAFRDKANSAGLEMHLVDNISEEIWRKFAMLGPFSGIACLSRLAVGTWAHTPEMLELFVEGMREVIALARLKGVDLDEPRLISRHTEFVKKLEPTWRGSMLTDLERGKAIEVGSLAGYVHRAGKAVGVATPFHSTAYRARCHYAGRTLPSKSRIRSAFAGDP